MATRTITKPRGRPNNRFGDRRIEVLRTAARVFSDLGFRQATLEDVARELGMTRAALYHYSPRKDALLTECGDIARQELMEALGHSRGEADGRARIAAFFRRYAAIVRSEKHTSELPSPTRTSYAVFCLKKKNDNIEYTR